MSITPQLSQSNWLERSPEVRRKIANTFEIPKSGATMLMGGTNGYLQSDGHLDKDLAHLTKEKMEKFLGLGTNQFTYFELFDMVLSIIDKPEPVVDHTPTVEENVLGEWKTTLQKIKDYSENINLGLKLKHIVWDMFPKPNVIIQEESIKSGKGRGSKKVGNN